MSQQRTIVRSVLWLDIFPWLILTRTFRMSLSVPLLVLAMAGIWATPLGWRLGELIFATDVVLETTSEFRPIVEARRRFPHQVNKPAFTQSNQRAITPATDGVRIELELDQAQGAGNSAGPLNRLQSLINADPGAIGHVFEEATTPWLLLFSTDVKLWQLAYLLFGCLWTLLVWSFLGAAMTRIAVVQLGREERVGLLESLRFAGGKFGWYFAAPIFPVLAILLLSIPAMLLGLFMLGNNTVIVAGIFWFFALLLGFLCAMLMIGLLFGWPLFWGAISAENSDAFDALSRGYAYTFQRPLHYLFYTFVSVLIGLVGWLLVSIVADTTIQAAWWGASWGANSVSAWSETTPPRLSEVAGAAESPDAVKDQGAYWVGAHLLRFFDGGVRTIAYAFAFSFFWCAASAVYLLLRRDVDQTEFDEVYVDGATPPNVLPPLEPDSRGVPQVADESDSQDSASVEGE